MHKIPKYLYSVYLQPWQEVVLRLQAITYNNIGCLFKRRNQPQLALQVGTGSFT